MLTFPVRWAAGTLLFGCTLFLLPYNAQSQRVAATVDSTESVIRYTGSATMHDWTGVSRRPSGTLVLDPDTPDSSRVLVEAPVASFNSGKDRRDRKMKEVTEAARFPTVSYRVTDIHPQRWDRSSDGHAGQWLVTGDLTFHGQTHPVDATVEIRITDDSVHAHAQFPVSLTRFGVERPELLWVKPIGDTIRIDARVVGAVESTMAQAPPVQTVRSEVTDTRRIASSDLRDVTLYRYAGHSAGLRAEARIRPNGATKWILAFYGFSENPTGMASAERASLSTGREVLKPLDVKGSTQTLDDGTTVEIARLQLSKDAFARAAQALKLEAEIGPARFATDWMARQDVREILHTVAPDSSRPVTVRDEQ